MRNLLLVLIIPTFLIGCSKDTKVDGWDTDKFKPHVATSWRTTPGGHLVDAGPFSSVTGGYVTEGDIDRAVDAAYTDFRWRFPEFQWAEARVHLTDDYVFWYSGQWVAGASEGQDVLLPIWSRCTSTADPGDQYIKRAPDQNYTWWRYTGFPLMPALRHELLHTAIGDPNHARAEWGRLGGPSEKVLTDGRPDPAQ